MAQKLVIGIGLVDGWKIEPVTVKARAAGANHTLSGEDRGE